MRPARYFFVIQLSNSRVLRLNISNGNKLNLKTLEIRLSVLFIQIALNSLFYFTFLLYIEHINIDKGCFLRYDRCIIKKEKGDEAPAYQMSHNR